VQSGENYFVRAVAVAVSAQGTFTPPPIFPIKHFRDLFTGYGPEVCIGATTGSGSIDEESFVQFIKRFNGRTKRSEDDPVLDNHSSHVSCQALE
jgi:hypothetical protein